MASTAQRTGWYHGWNVVGACVVSQVVALGLTLNSFSLFLPEWTAEFRMPVSQLALSVTLFSFVTATIAYYIGICTTRYPARRLLSGGLILLALAHFAMSAVTAGWQIIALYLVVMPAAIALSTAIVVQALVSRWFSQSSGLAMGISALGMAVGGVVFPPLIVALLPLVGWRMIWAGMGGLILAVAVPIILLIVRDRPAEDDSSIYARPVAGQRPIAAVVTIGQIVRRRNFWMIMIPFWAMQLIAITTSINITPIIASHGGTMAAAGLFLSVSSIASLFGKIGAGWVADRIGHARPLAMGAAVAGGGAMLLAVPDTGPTFLASIAIAIGIAGAAWTLLASAMLAEFGSADFGRAFALANALGTVVTVAPPAVAWAAELTGSFVPALIGLGAFALAAAAMVLLFYREPRPVTAMSPG